MSKKINKIVINPESIDIVSEENGVNNVTQISLEPQDNEVQTIFEKYNLNSITNYPFDTKIVRALAENEEQLRDYLEVCKFASRTDKKIEFPDSIPQIEYDFTGLKSSQLDLPKQLQMYKEAKRTQQTFKKCKGKVDFRIGIFDNGYYAIQDLLQNRRKTTQALQSAETKQKPSLRETLRDPNLTVKTNEVAKEYAQMLTGKPQEKTVGEERIN